jgi:hypothetical protein
VRRQLTSIIGLVLGLMPVLALAQVPASTSFTSFITNAPPATIPLGPNDKIPVVQGNLTHSVTPASLAAGIHLITTPFSAPVTSDQYALTVQAQTGTTANQIWQEMICNGPCSTFTADALRSIVVVPDQSTDLVNAIAGYTKNNNTQGTLAGQERASVSVGAYGISNVAGAYTWGFDSILADCSARSGCTGTRGLFNEFDFNISNAGTIGGGLMLGGTALVQPAGVNGFAVNSFWGNNFSSPSPPFAKWANGLILQDGCCQVSLSIGAQDFDFSTNSNNAGGSIALGFWDATSSHAKQAITLAADAGATSGTTGGTLFIGGSSGWGITLPDGSSNAFGLSLGALATSGANIASQSVVFIYRDNANVRQNYTIGVDASQQLTIAGSTAAQTLLIDQPGIKLGNVPLTGAATGSICVSAGNLVFIKTTAGACL